MPDNPFADSDLDAVEQRLERLASGLEAEFGTAIRVDREHGSSGRTWEVTPASGRALGVVWTAGLGGALQLETTRSHGGRWELTRTEEDATFIDEVVRSIAAGRVSETRAPGRSRITVSLASGQTIRETSYATATGCLPMPFWPRWSTTHHYEPYRSPHR